MTRSVKVERLEGLARRAVGPMVVGEFVGESSADNLSSYSIEIPPAGRFPPNYHKAAEEVVLVLDGSARVVLGGVEYDIVKGHLLFIPPGIVHSIVAGPDGFRGLVCQAPGISERHDTFFVNPPG